MRLLCGGTSFRSHFSSPPQDAALAPPEVYTGPFEPAPTFTGPRPGFAFKLGPAGLGYYGDAPPKPTALGGNAGAGRARRPAVWQLVTDNVYIHRHAKVMHEDDVMLCACEPIRGGGGGGGSAQGCGPHCINRTLNVECVSGHCVAADAATDSDCGNQQFTRKQGAKIASARAGRKGFGLFAVDAIPRGAFIVEYVGEVLEEEEYARRKQFYAEV